MQAAARSRVRRGPDLLTRGSGEQGLGAARCGRSERRESGLLPPCIADPRTAVRCIHAAWPLDTGYVWTRNKWTHTACALHVHCMRTACALHAHCMRTTCALHAHCMRTACALSNFMCAAGGRMEEDQGQVADGHEGATPSPAPLPLLPVSHPITTEERRRRAIRHRHRHGHRYTHPPHPPRPRRPRR